MSAATPAWNAYRVMVFAGQYDTHVGTGEDYDTRTIASIFTMEPGEKPKSAGLAFIPSTYRDYDGREHKAQRERGSYVTLTGDIDQGNHALDRIETLVRAFAGDCAWLIYSSPHALPGDMRWRVIMPLDQPVVFDLWHDAQHAFFDFMELAGVKMDRAPDRAAQPVYLPNVPAEHAKSGEPLRSSDGAALHYQRSSSGLDAPGLRIDVGAVATGVASIAQRRADADRERERIRKEAERKRASRPASDNAALIDDFNASTSIITLLELYRYEQSPRHPEDWHSPLQTGDTYATRVIGEKWISLSGSDADAGLGSKCSSGCYGDAYDLFVQYEHRGDHTAAFRHLGAERRDAQPPRSNAAPFSDEPPAWMDEADSARADTLPAAPARARYDDFGADAEIIEAARAAPDRPAQPFEIADLAMWAGSVPTPKAFVMVPFIPREDVIIITGDGGTNKSTMALQISAAAAASKPFLGMDVAPGPALYVTAEDDQRENHWRLAKIAEALGTSIHDLAGKLHIVSLRGRLNNELATFDSEGKLRPAAAYAMLCATIKLTGAKLVTLDNVAHLFTGSENDRSHVTAFINLLYQICNDFGVTILLIAHRNKAGDSYSGSTAWLNAVRSQLLLERTDEHDPDARRLSLGKANYARQGESLDFRWNDFALVRDSDLPDDRQREIAETVMASADNAAFLACLAERNSQRRQVSEKPTAANFAPKMFVGMPQAKGLTKVRLEKAMDRLYRAKAIERGFLYRDTAEGKNIEGLREVGKTGPEGSPDQPETSPETSRKHIPEGTGNPQKTTGNTPLYINIPGAALGPAAPVERIGGAPREFSRFDNAHLGRMVLAPGEAGDDVEF